MTLILYFLVGILACYAVAQKGLEKPKMSLLELERILKHLAAQTALQKRGKSFQYLPHYSRPELLERSEDREEKNENDSAQSMEFYDQLENLRLEKQLEDDLQQALRLESDRICRATGRCGCTRGRCGRPSRTIDRTVSEVDQLLDLLNQQQQNRNHQQQQENRQENHRSQEYDERRHRRRQKGNKKKQEDRRQRQINRIKEQDDRKLKLDDRLQEFKVRERQLERDDEDELFRDLGVASKTYKNPDFDFVVLEVPESRELQNRGNGIKIADVEESKIQDLLQKRQSYEENEETEGRVDNLNLEDFVAYYEKIKKELTNGLLKYIKGLGDGSYLSQLLSYQKRQIENLKKSQSKIPSSDHDLKAKIVQLLYGSLSSIKIRPHSNDGRTIYVPQKVVNAIPSIYRKQVLRSSKKILPLTLHQKQRQQSS